MEKTIFKTGICANCGGDNGLHQYKEPHHCPKNGREPYGDKPQEWQDTYFEDSGEKQLIAAAPLLYEACEAISIWEDYAQRHPNQFNNIAELRIHALALVEQALSLAK